MILIGDDDIQISAVKTTLLQRGGEILSEIELEIFLKKIDALKKGEKISTKKLTRYMFDNESIENIKKGETDKSQFMDYRDSSNKSGRS